jgi:hypothetical protein
MVRSPDANPVSVEFLLAPGKRHRAGVEAASKRIRSLGFEVHATGEATITASISEAGFAELFNRRPTPDEPAPRKRMTYEVWREKPALPVPPELAEWVETVSQPGRHTKF